MQINNAVQLNQADMSRPSRRRLFCGRAGRGCGGLGLRGGLHTGDRRASRQSEEPANWLMTRGNYKGWSYSALDQINTRNVRNLVPVWSFSDRS